MKNEGDLLLLFLLAWSGKASLENQLPTPKDYVKQKRNVLKNVFPLINDSIKDMS